MKQIGFTPRKKKSVYPNQYICEEKANGVMCNGNFYPYITATGFDSFNYLTADGNLPYITAPDPTKRYYLKNVWFSFRCGESYAGGWGYVRVYLQNRLSYIAYTLCPTTPVGGFYSSSTVVECRVLCDLNTGIFVNGCGEQSRVSVVFAQIDVLPVELKPMEV